jgi:hypothetical protein
MNVEVDYTCLFNDAIWNNLDIYFVYYSLYLMPTRCLVYLSCFLIDGHSTFPSCVWILVETIRLIGVFVTNMLTLLYSLEHLERLLCMCLLLFPYSIIRCVCFFYKLIQHFIIVAMLFQRHVWFEPIKAIILAINNLILFSS